MLHLLLFEFEYNAHPRVFNFWRMQLSRQLLLRAAPFVRRRPERATIQLKTQGPSSSGYQIVIKPKAKVKLLATCTHT